jgi:plastocyanin
MEERERRARMLPDGPGSALARWLALASAPAAVVVVLVMAVPAAGAPQTITATNFSFGPVADVTINQGETVTWRNTMGEHNVVLEGPDGFEFPNPPAPPTNTMVWPFTRTLNAPGTWQYYCRPHRGLGMTGSVRVLAIAPADPPPGPGTPPGGTPPGGTPPGGGGGSQPGGPSTGSPGAGKSSTKVTLQVSDATPDSGDRVRFFGTVRPAQDGRRVQLQRRVGRSYRTVAKIKLTGAGSSRSKFSKRVRVVKDSVFRARLSADGAHAAGTSGSKRVNVR